MSPSSFIGRKSAIFHSAKSRGGGGGGGGDHPHYPPLDPALGNIDTDMCFILFLSVGNSCTKVVAGI